MEQTGNEEWQSFKTGDRRGFQWLYDSYCPHLENYARRFSNDTALLEECIQDLFVKLWLNRETLGNPASVKHYLFKSFRHLLYNKLAGKRKILPIGDHHDFEHFDLSVPAFEGKEELSEKMQQMLRKLTPRQQEAIFLFYVEDMSYQEIADVLNMQVGGAYKLIYRALDNLKANAEMYLLTLLITSLRLLPSTTIPVAV
ncbi:RNA polymerase sigma factor [Chitinophaga arvensicola]|uniref:RNA polymerase sigma factor, sigma-70 family n=1 Tax=Chitinophaga arvensicola TaxID=29529 RepID=A0A1I0RPD2_9BACT|nr:sigma-70 family RNA polymerase sigma factor [Chitinophaga arvensicola]SEW43159.1 RNA polymerase sigma factor, sigma-70 family [Chitinophaga arvensicola]